MARQASPHSAASVWSTTGVRRLPSNEPPPGRGASGLMPSVSSCSAEAVEGLEEPLVDRAAVEQHAGVDLHAGLEGLRPACRSDRKSTRLNSSHPSISYAVFCLKKKKTKPI